MATIGNTTLLGTVAAFNLTSAKKLVGTTQQAVLAANQRLIAVHVGWGPGNGTAAGSVQVALLDEGNASANKPVIAGTVVNIAYDASTLSATNQWISVTGLSVDLSAHAGKTLAPAIAPPNIGTNSGFSVLLGTVSGATRTNYTSGNQSTVPDPFISGSSSANQAWSLYFETETITGAISPSVIASTVSVPSPVVSGSGVSITPSVIASTLSVPNPTVSATAILGRQSTAGTPYTYQPTYAAKRNIVDTYTPGPGEEVTAFYVYFDNNNAGSGATMTCGVYRTDTSALVGSAVITAAAGTGTHLWHSTTGLNIALPSGVECSIAMSAPSHGIQINRFAQVGAFEDASISTLPDPWSGTGYAYNFPLYAVVESTPVDSISPTVITSGSVPSPIMAQRVTITTPSYTPSSVLYGSAGHVAGDHIEWYESTWGNTTIDSTGEAAQTTSAGVYVRIVDVSVPETGAWYYFDVADISVPAITATVVFPTHTVNANPGVITPTVIASGVTLPAPVVAAAGTLLPTVITTGSVPSPTLGATLTATVVSTTVSLPSPSLGQTVAPAAIASTFSAPSPTVRTVQIECVVIASGLVVPSPTVYHTISPTRIEAGLGVIRPGVGIYEDFNETVVFYTRPRV